MAVDCLGLTLSTREYDHTALPKASSPESIELKNEEFLVLIEIDLLEYKKRTNMKSVKKTLTVPEWLNQEALSKGINFSQVLQEAFISKRIHLKTPRRQGVLKCNLITHLKALYQSKHNDVKI